MDILQVQKDLQNGVTVSKATWLKLLEAAIIQNEALHAIIDDGAYEVEYQIATNALVKVFEL